MGRDFASLEYIRGYSYKRPFPFSENSKKLRGGLLEQFQNFWKYFELFDFSLKRYLTLSSPLNTLPFLSGIWKSKCIAKVISNDGTNPFFEYAVGVDQKVLLFEHDTDLLEFGAARYTYMSYPGWLRQPNWPKLRGSIIANASDQKCVQESLIDLRIHYGPLKWLSLGDFEKSPKKVWYEKNFLKNF